MIRWRWLAVVTALAGCRPTAPHTAAHLNVRLIYASNRERVTDPRLRDFVHQFSGLRYTGYQLRDEAGFHLEPQSAGRLQLPDHSWLVVTSHGENSDGALRLDVDMDALQFSTRVSIAPGATLALAGPTYEQGRFIVSVTLLPD